MKTLVLHIGMHKTGSSSIQDTLHANREILLAHDINYYRELQPNHAAPMSVIFEDDPFERLPRLKHSLRTKERLREFRAKKIDRLRSCLQKNKSSYFIISAESMVLFSPENIESLKAFVMPYFDKVVIVGYVRPPKSFIISLTQQLIKTRGYFLEQIVQDLPVPDYRSRFEKYLEAFRGHQVLLQLFHKSTLTRGCVVASFLEALGAAPEVYDRLQLQQTNHSLSLSKVKILSAINSQLPDLDFLTRNDDEFEGIDHARFTLPDRLLSPVIENIQDDILWMENILGVSLSEHDVSGDGDSSILELSAAERDIVEQIVSQRKREARSRLVAATTAHAARTLGRYAMVVKESIYRLMPFRRTHR